MLPGMHSERQAQNPVQSPLQPRPQAVIPLRARSCRTRLTAERIGIRWEGRRYDRQNPMAADLPNQALNHAASAVEGAAAIAVAATAAIPQLGFVHEDSGQSFVLDVA